MLQMLTVKSKNVSNLTSDQLQERSPPIVSVSTIALVVTSLYLTIFINGLIIDLEQH